MICDLRIVIGATTSGMVVPELRVLDEATRSRSAHECKSQSSCQCREAAI